MPGRNGNSLPYGTVRSSNFRSLGGWINNGDENFDYGAIIIPTNLGNTTGWFGFGVYADANLVNAVGNIAGYPGDQPSGTCWYDAHRIASVNARKVYYDIDTFGGQTGARSTKSSTAAASRSRSTLTAERRPTPAAVLSKQSMIIWLRGRSSV
jgi:V8-like Glu-specific endopeptidase